VLQLRDIHPECHATRELDGCATPTFHLTLATVVTGILGGVMGSARLAAAVPFSIALALAGCGTFVPEIQEFPYDSTDGELLVHAIVVSVHCELRNAIATVINNDLLAAKRNKGARQAAYLDNWGAQLALTLQVEEKTTLNPTAAWTPHSALTSIFTLNGGLNLSADATRIDKLNYYYTVKELYTQGSCPQNFSLPHAPGSLLIQSDLKLAQWLSSQVLEVGTAEVGVPNSPDTILKQNALSHEVTFEVVSGGNIVPAWKLVESTVGQTGSLFTASRDRRHDLTITFGPVDPTMKGTLAPTAQGVFVSSQIGLAVSNSNNTRRGLFR